MTKVPELGEPFEIDWKVVGHVNSAEISYYHQRVEVFMHQFEDEDLPRLWVTQDWLDEHEPGPGTENSEYVRAYVEGVVVDPDNPFDHFRVDEPGE